MLQILYRKPWALYGMLFAFFTVLFLAIGAMTGSKSPDTRVIVLGNLIIYLATIISFIFYRRSLRRERAAYIMRMVYWAFLSKMAICLAAALAYILIERSAVDPLALAICFALYFIYTFAEVGVLLRMNKEQKNG